MADEGSRGPLHGLTVVDFSRVLAGPLAAMTLGDLGADVVKVERPDGGDDTRSWGPPFTDDGASAYFLAVNRNKRSLVLDLRDPADVAVARRIAVSADVVIENFRAGTMEGFGLGYEALAAENPGLVYCRISGFGAGAGRDLPGYDFIAQAVSGLMSITGDADGAPTKTGVAIVDVLAGLNAAVGILAAVHERRSSGRGQRVEVDLFTSALAGLVNQASNYLVTGVPPHRMGNRHPSIAPYETLRTATDPIAVAAGNDRQFSALCLVLGMSEATGDARWSTNAARVEHRDELVEQLESRLREAPAEDWVPRLQEAGIPCGTVNGIDAAFALAATLGIDAVRTLRTTDGRERRSVASPITLSRTPVTYRLAPPL